VSHSTIQRVWREYPIERERTRLAALAHDPRFQPLSLGVSGVYLSPPHGAVVISDHVPKSLRASPRLPSPSVARSRSVPLPGTESALELVHLLARLESFPAARSSARLTRKEFLAFLGSVADHSARGERSHVLLTPTDESLRSMAAQGSSRAHEFSVVDSKTSASLHELVGHWLLERSRNPRTEVALDELPKLRQAVERWASELGGSVRPFAWVNARRARGISEGDRRAGSPAGTVDT
jgi:hypothetical protein